MKLIIALLMLTHQAFAFEKVKTFAIDKGQDPYYQISSITIKEIAAADLDLKDAESFEKADLNQIIMFIDGIIAIGKKIWPIIEAGKPVVDVNMASGVSVIPFKKGDDYNSTIFQMEGWSMPAAKKYNITYKNGFGSNVISFDYTVSYQFGGSLDGKGKYLAGVNVTASNVSVAWGFNFQASSEVLQLSNHGTKENPVAGATFRVNYTAKTVIKQITSSDSFHITGSGLLSKF